jgi:hypothetical protein
LVPEDIVFGVADPEYVGHIVVDRRTAPSTTGMLVHGGVAFVHLTPEGEESSNVWGQLMEDE